MGSKQSVFQIFLLILFGVFALIGIIVVATNRNDDEREKLIADITIWGPPMYSDIMSDILRDLKEKDDLLEKVKYVEKNPHTIYGDLLEAMSTGDSPDIVIMNSSGLLPLKNKIYPIPVERLPLHTFRDTYVEGSEIFVLDNSVYALPLAVDPLVLYWNRTLFKNAAIAKVPKDWDTLVDLTYKRLSKINGGADLTQSAIAFGEYDNVLHAKEILSALFMQTGSGIVYRKNGYFTINNNDIKKASLALKFYTSFSNPIKTVYSWNKTFDRSLEAFASDRVAMYAGFVSDEPIIKKINLNLNFDMTTFPQSNNNIADVTYGNFYGLAVLKTSKNPQAGLYVANVMTSRDVSKRLSEASGLPSARRDVLTDVDPSDPTAYTKVQSAIMAKSWLEPAPQSAVNTAFKRGINNTVSGTVGYEQATGQIFADINALLKRYKDK